MIGCKTETYFFKINIYQKIHMSPCTAEWKKGYIASDQ